MMQRVSFCAAYHALGTVAINFFMVRVVAVKIHTIAKGCAIKL